MPFIRGSQIDTLSYYVGSPYEAGTIITIPVRKKEARGMVTSCKPVSAAKTAIRTATFSLRKLPDQPDSKKLPDALMKTVERLLTRTPTTTGAALYALLPPEVRDGTQTLHADDCEVSNTDAATVSVLQALTEERYRVYRSQIREAFAHRGSVLFVVPTSADVERACEELSRGIADRIVVFSPRFGVKKLERSYESLGDVRHAKLIITTPRHAFIDRHDLTTIIVEQSRSPYYKSKVRPYFDMSEVLKELAGVTNRTLLLGDILPHAEDEHARRSDRYLTEDEHPKRLTFGSAFKVIVQNEKPSAEAPFQLFSKQLKNTLSKLVGDRANMFLLAARRGLAPVVVCIDCGHIFRCPDSGTPYSLLKTKQSGTEERWFLSSTSGKRVRAPDTCTECGSWRLAERGIGIQQIEEELKKLFPDLPVILFDHTTATTYKKARTLITTFYDTKGAVLLGTQMAVPYLDTPVTYSAVTSLDATRAIPTWRADEELLALLLTLRERTSEIVYVQSRTEPDTLIDYATRGLVDQFYTDEIELRRALSYPPFATFILLGYTGTREQLGEQEELITKTLTPTKVQHYTAATGTSGLLTRNALIRMPNGTWPDPELLLRLRSLPPNIRIEIDPHRIV